jgi:transcriptional regulator with XRE-family HTH domain
MYRDYTLEQAAEALSGPPHDMPTTHTSLGRYENGKQMPSAEMLEAIARLYRTDVKSLLDERPPALAKTG